jgi:muramoyltetrapeptide carboxypeptidase
MKRRSVRLEKPKALRKGSRLAVVAPSSPAEPEAIAAGIRELTRLGFEMDAPPVLVPDGYFAAEHGKRAGSFSKAFHDKKIQGVIATRGGYGANYLIDFHLATSLMGPKCLVGFSDLNIIQLLLLEIRQWTGFYGPMAAAGFNRGNGNPNGYDELSFLQSVTETKSGWEIPLQGEAYLSGRSASATGRVVGGCLTMLQTTLGSGWEPDTDGAILLLEDRGMKPYQVDRAMRHLQQAGKLAKVAGIVLGDFPDCEPAPGSPTIHEILEPILSPLRVPVIYGAPVGHTKRPMLTIPLGVRARLHAKGEGLLEILEPAVTE